MKKTLKKYFIPHAGNNYLPHILHTRRAIFYLGVGIIMKAILIVFALLVPSQAYLAPDILQNQYNKLLAMTNALRVENGVASLTFEKKLDRSADLKATDMAQNKYFSHRGPSGHNLQYFLKKAGYGYKVAGENLAMGFYDAESVMNAWKKSPTHYSNLIDPDFKELGVGLARSDFEGDDTVFIAQHFGTPMKGVLGEKTTTNTVEKVKIVTTTVVLAQKPTMAQKYSLAKNLLEPITGLFNVSRNIYLAFIVFFITALLINILVEIRKQHFHIILQTMLLVGLMVGLWRI